jgi:hypothetical protein
MTTTLKTQNPTWGFFGTIERAGESAETAWELAFTAIQDATGAHDGNAYGPEGVRDFLDSRDGRHFADEVANALSDGLQLEAAISAATDRYKTWTINRRLSRATGIPAGLPYLDGMVGHYAIEADLNENA